MAILNYHDRVGGCYDVEIDHDPMADNTDCCAGCFLYMSADAGNYLEGSWFHKMADGDNNTVQEIAVIPAP